MDYIPNARAQAANLLQDCRERYFVEEHEILEYIIYSWMSGTDALQCLEDFIEKELNADY